MSRSATAQVCPVLCRRWLIQYGVAFTIYQEETFMRSTPRPRAAGFVALLALLAALTFAACAPRNASQTGGGNSSSGQTTTQGSGSQGASNQTATNQTTANPDIQSVQNADNSIQTTLQSLQSASSDANTDYSSQDNPTVP
jgi:hypothetical protein